MTPPEQNAYAPPKVDESVPRAADALAAMQDGPRGIGGWLVLPLIGLIISPIRIVLTSIRDFTPVFEPDTWAALTTAGGPSYHPLWVPLIMFEIVANSLLVLFTLFVLVLFLKKHRRVPQLMIALLLSIVAVLGADHLLAQQIPALAALPETKNTMDLTRAMIGAMIWIPYFLKSKRVKNTFVN